MVRLIISMLLLSVLSLQLEAASVVTGRWGKQWSPEQIIGVQSKRPQQLGPFTTLVVVSLNSSCPMARRMSPTINRIASDYEAKGVQFVGLFANAHETMPTAANFAVEMDIPYPIFLDSKNRRERWATELGVTRTPEVVVLDVSEGYHKKKLVYQGAIDDSLIPTGGKEVASNEFLRNSLEALLNGKPISIPHTISNGCLISTQEFHDLGKYRDVTYYKNVEPIINARCQRCHQEGDVAGESYLFETYEDVANNYEAVKFFVVARIMPPWHAYLNKREHPDGFVNDMRLSDEELKILIAWGENGLKAGDASQRSKALKHWPKATDWLIGGGKPEFIYNMQEPYQVPTKDFSEYKYFRIPLGFSKDRWIREIQLRPGNSVVVHHISAILAPVMKKNSDAKDLISSLYGLTGESVKKVGDYVPGDPFNARTWPEGMALKVPRKTDIVLEVHYTPTGRVELPDRSGLGIVWASEPPENEVVTRIFTKNRIHIDPFAQHSRIERYFHFREDVLVTAFAPHMHYRGKDFTLYRVTGRGTKNEIKTRLFTVPAYDINWQRTYELKTPIRLKAGDALYGVGHFDNSPYNPHNPDPTQAVRYGLESTDEMFNFRVKYLVDRKRG